MAESDYNIVKPVDAPQNIGILNPIQHNAERKSRRGGGQRKSAKEQNPQSPEQSPADKGAMQDTDDQHGIDFCA